MHLKIVLSAIVVIVVFLGVFLANVYFTAIDRDRQFVEEKHFTQSTIDKIR